MKNDVSAVLSALMEYDTAEDAVRSGRFLFHGTSEEIYENLETGPDYILWAALNPTIAQLYITESNPARLYRIPAEQNMNRPVVPILNADPKLSHRAQSVGFANPIWFNLAERLGFPKVDRLQMTFDEDGWLRSWRYPEGWPTNRELLDHLEQKYGYTADQDGIMRLRFSEDDGKQLLHGDHEGSPAKLFVTLRDNLSIRDLRRTQAEIDQEDLFGEVEDYHNIDGFKKAGADGVGLVKISDLAQSRAYGNVPHVSYGVTEAGVSKLEWLELPARYRELADDDFVSVTQDFQEFFDNLRAEYSCAHMPGR